MHIARHFGIAIALAKAFDSRVDRALRIDPNSTPAQSRESSDSTRRIDGYVEGGIPRTKRDLSVRDVERFPLCRERNVG